MAAPLSPADHDQLRQAAWRRLWQLLLAPLPPAPAANEPADPGPRAAP